MENGEVSNAVEWEEKNLEEKWREEGMWGFMGAVEQYNKE